ncbi:MAG: ribbon-helix-helix domain-containing protein [Thiohalocapsa sp.]|jgi:hypothetical protein|uniref:ribbon-helix-helix protein, CopG family n=1 Tax=Thiohalocapsa sp. TaxID=2497641 RepID=UPI0025D3D97C|nr:ribbon-helix-helix domain-containing protein [Thiohalocapsa sp.]MCG6939823.1 ribbon-helix-helix domain-containing protein [Thiohalocapsa sp.]
MHRTQISLEPEQYRRLGDEARRRGISLAALIRGLIDEHLDRSQPPADDPLDALIGIGEGSGEPVGRDHDRHLYGLDGP